MACGMAADKPRKKDKDNMIFKATLYAIPTAA